MHIWIKVSTKNCFCYFKNVCINFESSEPRLMGVENITPIHLSITLRPTITHITLPPTLLSIALRTTQFLTIIRSFDNYESCKKKKGFFNDNSKNIFCYSSNIHMKIRRVIAHLLNSPVSFNGCIWLLCKM